MLCVLTLNYVFRIELLLTISCQVFHSLPSLIQTGLTIFKYVCFFNSDSTLVRQIRSVNLFPVSWECKPGLWCLQRHRFEPQPTRCFYIYRTFYIYVLIAWYCFSHSLIFLISYPCKRIAYKYLQNGVEKITASLLNPVSLPSHLLSIKFRYTITKLGPENQGTGDSTAVSSQIFTVYEKCFYHQYSHPWHYSFQGWYLNLREHKTNAGNL